MDTKRGRQRMMAGSFSLATPGWGVSVQKDFSESNYACRRPGTTPRNSMELRKHFNRIERAHKLIARKSTGPPHMFAAKVGLSRRQLYNLLDTMREYVGDIRYSRQQKTFYYVSRDARSAWLKFVLTVRSHWRRRK